MTDQTIDRAYWFEDVRPDVTPETHPDHHVVGREWAGHDSQDVDWKGTRWFCFSHDRHGYWMYATDGSGHWTNISERAIRRSFHEIYYFADDPGHKPRCGWFANSKVPPYVQSSVIMWKRVARQGFIGSHWIGYINGVERFRIDQRKPSSAGRRSNTRHAYLARKPNTLAYQTAERFDNVAAAKAHAQATV